MKLSFSKVLLFVILTSGIIIFTQTSCKKDNCEPSAISYPIQGLWVGTFTTVSGFTQPPGTDFYLALSIYPDGKMSYKSGTGTIGFFVYAEGTWNLTGNNLSWTAKTINSLTSPQVDVSGTAIYNSTNGTLTNGVATTTSPATQGTWKMNRIN